MATSNADLQQQIYPQIHQNQLLLQPSLLPAVGDMLDALRLPTLTLEQATPHSDVEYAKVTGSVRLPTLKLNDPLSVTFVAMMNGQQVDASLTLDALPQAWLIRSSFDNLPATIGFSNNIPVLKPSLLEAAHISNPALVVRNLPDSGQHLWAGLNLVGTITVNEVFDRLMEMLQLHPPALALTALITLPKQAGQPAAFDLRARIADKSYTIGGYPLNNLFARIWTYIPPDLDQDVPDTRLGIGGAVQLGHLEPIIITADVTDVSSFWNLAVELDESAGQTFDGFDNFAGLAGGDTTLFALPAAVDATGLRLKTLALGFQTPATLLYSHLAITASKPWNPIPELRDQLAITLHEAGWTLTRADNKYQNAGYVSGSVTWQLAGRNYILDLDATLPDFAIQGQLSADHDGLLSSDDILRHFGMADPLLPTLTLEDLSIGVNVQQNVFNLYTALSGRWSLPLGALGAFAIDSELVVQLTYNRAWSGMFAGRADLAGIALDGQYTLGSSNFLIEGRAADLNVWNIVQKVCNDLTAIDTVMNTKLQALLDIHNPYVSIEKSGQSYTLKLGGEFFGGQNQPKLTVNFAIVDSASGFGAFIGVQLSNVSGTSLSNLTGLDLHAFDDYIQNLDLALAFSSIDAPGYAFTIPSLPSKMQISFPTSIQIVAGVTIVADLNLGQALLERFLGEFGVKQLQLFAAIQITKDDLKLIAGFAASANAPHSINGTFKGLDISVYLELEAKEMTLLLVGQLNVVVQQQSLQFDMSLAVTENGFTLAGSMQGTWPDVFGVRGLELSDAALAVGVDWEGVPTLGFAGTLTVPTFTDRGFEGSLAVIANSDEPAQSALAGAISDLSLGKILVVLAGVAEADLNKDPLTKPLLAVLNNISIQGFTDFQTSSVPAGLQPALDRASQGGTAKSTDYFQAINQIVGAFNHELSNNLLVVRAAGAKVPTWYITDRGNNLTHYALSLDGAQIAVEKEAQFYFVEADVDLGPGLQYKAGNRISGSLRFEVLEGMVDVIINTSKGISLYAALDPISLFSDDFLSITSGKNDGKGPTLAVLTYQNPDFPDGNPKPHLAAKGAVRILGYTFLSVDLQISSSGLEFDFIERTFLGGIHLIASISKAKIRGSASLTVGLSRPIDLGDLGLIHLPSATAGIGFCWHDCANLIDCQGTYVPPDSGAHALLCLAFDIFGPHCIGPVGVDLTLLAHLVDTVVEQVTKFFKDLFTTSAKEWLTWVYHGILTGIAEIGTVLKKDFNVLWREAAQLMQSVGYAAQVIIDTIVKGYSLAEAEVTEFVDEIFEKVKDCAMKTAHDIAVTSAA